MLRPRPLPRGAAPRERPRGPSRALALSVCHGAGSRRSIPGKPSPRGARRIGRSKSGRCKSSQLSWTSRDPKEFRASKGCGKLLRTQRAPGKHGKQLHELSQRLQIIVSKEIPKAKKITFGHLGDGNIHYNISQPENLSQDSFFKLERPLREKLLSLIVNMDGSFSAEHGIGIVRKKDALKIKGDEIKIMKSIKKSLDPKNILNPGKIFD